MIKIKLSTLEIIIDILFIKLFWIRRIKMGIEMEFMCYY